MESKKPRLELIPESDYEAESESDSEDSSSSFSSPTSSLFRSSTLPTFTLATTSFTTSSLPTFMTPRVSSFAIPNICSSNASNIPTFSIQNVRPISTPNSFSAAAPRLFRSTNPNLLPPGISIASPFTNSNVFPFATPNVPPLTSISNLSSAVIPNMPVSTNSNSAAIPRGSSTSNVPSSLSRPSTSNTHSNSNMSSTDTFSPGDPHDGEQLRSSFRSACEAVNYELDSLMQPSKSKQQTLKAIEDYLVALSNKATSIFKVDLIDDSHAAKISLKVDKNNVSVFSQNTPNQEGEDAQYGPSRDAACWMPPVNPFTSSVTLRQHLEAASNNNVRPRRMRPPPGFHPTPQYNVSNLGTSGSSVDKHSSSSAVVRPPPGFQAIAAASETAVPGPSTSSLQGCYGPLCAATNPDQLLHSTIPRQRPGAESEKRASSQFAPQGRRGTPSLTSDSTQSASSETDGNKLWEHFTNAAAAATASGSSIDPSGTGYWDDFLRREVYNNATSDQHSELWKQFKDYQKVQYAPGSLRTGTTIFTSENTGALKHGPVGHCRPRNHSQAQSRPIDNISIQRNFDQLEVSQLLRNPNQSSQEVLTLSDRFKNAAISNSTGAMTSGNELPRNRNAMLGALLNRRLQERVANSSPATTATHTSTTMSVVATTASSTATPSTNTVTNTNITIVDSGASGEGRSDTAQNSVPIEEVPCSYCLQNNKAAGVPTHVLRDRQGRTVCPILRNKPCPICNKNGDYGHTVHDCPIRKQWDMDDNKAGKGSS